VAGNYIFEFQGLAGNVSGIVDAARDSAINRM